MYNPRGEALFGSILLIIDMNIVFGATKIDVLDIQEAKVLNKYFIV